MSKAFKLIVEYGSTAEVIAQGLSFEDALKMLHDWEHENPREQDTDFPHAAIIRDSVEFPSPVEVAHTHLSIGEVLYEDQFVKVSVDEISLTEGLAYLEVFDKEGGHYEFISDKHFTYPLIMLYLKSQGRIIGKAA